MLSAIFPSSIGAATADTARSSFASPSDSELHLTWQCCTLRDKYMIKTGLPHEVEAHTRMSGWRGEPDLAFWTKHDCTSRTSRGECTSPELLAAEHRLECCAKGAVMEGLLYCADVEAECEREWGAAASELDITPCAPATKDDDMIEGCDAKFCIGWAHSGWPTTADRQANEFGLLRKHCGSHRSDPYASEDPPFPPPSPAPPRHPHGFVVRPPPPPRGVEKGWCKCRSCDFCEGVSKYGHGRPPRDDGACPFFGEDDGVALAPSA